MKTPKIKWPTKKSKRDSILSDVGYTKSEVEDRIVIAVQQAEKMAKKADKRIAKILDENKTKWISCWNSDDTLVLWFGKVTKKSHIKDVGKRMSQACDRVANKVLTIKIRPADGSTNASNGGGFLSPKTFKVYPKWIKKDDCPRGAIIIHELLHEWFADQKIDGEKVYGSSDAKKLAKEEPKKARKSAENYEQYCRDLHC